MKQYSTNLIWQPLIAILYTAMVLWILDHMESSQITWALGAGSLSASSCIVFTYAKAKTAYTREIIGGYLIASAVGASLHFLLIKLMPIFTSDLGLYNGNSFWILASLSVGITIILMVLLKAVHPPAVSMTLILVIDIEHYAIIGIILLAALILAGLHYALKPYLQNLVQ